MTTLQTSSLLFIRPDGKLILEGEHRQECLSLTDIELLSRFAEPCSIEEGQEAGFSKEQIDKAKTLGCLVERNEADVPRAGIWETYNLQRAASLMYETINSDSCSQRFQQVMKTSGFEENFDAFLKRRTERFYIDEAVSNEAFHRLLKEVADALVEYPWLSMKVLVQAVEGVEPGVYALNNKTATLEQTMSTYVRKELLECVHGQWWINGGGFCCFFVVSFDELAKNTKNGSSPKSYFEMILLLGEAGQVLLNAASSVGLGSWMTPAVSESVAGKILGLDENEEALYFFKLGIPDRGGKDSGEKRSPLEH